ncbi:proline-rich protein 6 [Thraustotheca clavata]|uniref:Proline-rich protein 6 n=1 Tax=Thraustotheca clavata TaxID=74557 RepID=A0A1V9ZN82_9STRA|nr:proline-rich protein 6 [Thraustotheca clavata]
MKHFGYCHCKAVQFEFEAPDELVAWDCNCSICLMKKNVHTIVPASAFHLTQGADVLTTYTFNTHTAKHQFCRICGVQPFYIPRSNPDGYAITIACIAPGTVKHFEIKKYDGQNWEAQYETADISKYSKALQS